MKTLLLRPFAGLGLAALVALTACIVPPSAYQRALWGPPPEHWQSQGRFAQEEAPPAEGARVVAAPAPLADATAEPSSQAAPEPPLYAWDGGIVAGAPQGQVTQQEGAPRGLETPPEGRMHIIELYQQVLDERDALAQEVELLRETLERTSLALEAESKVRSDLEARVASLEEGQRGLMADNRAIADRLVTAQIRRLEAEKLLLETRLEIERAREAESAANEPAKASTRPRSTPEQGGRP